jgi:hypothetical protein
MGCPAPKNTTPTDDQQGSKRSNISAGVNTRSIEPVTESACAGTLPTQHADQQHETFYGIPEFVDDDVNGF